MGLENRRRRTLRRARSQREAEENRIEVHQKENGVITVRYRGKNSQTRYQPPRMTAWQMIRESFGL